MKMAEIYNAKAQKGGDAKAANVDKAIAVYNSFAAKYPQLKAYADLQAANIAFQNELDDKALENYQKVITEVENKQYDEDEKGYLMQAYKNAGYIYWSSKNDLETAASYFEKLIRLDLTMLLPRRLWAWRKRQLSNEVAFFESDINIKKSSNKQIWAVKIHFFTAFMVITCLFLQA